MGIFYHRAKIPYKRMRGLPLVAMCIYTMPPSPTYTWSDAARYPCQQNCLRLATPCRHDQGCECVIYHHGQVHVDGTAKQIVSLRIDTTSGSGRPLWPIGLVTRCRPSSLLSIFCVVLGVICALERALLQARREITDDGRAQWLVPFKACFHY